MRARIVSCLVVVFLLVMLPVALATNKPEPAQAAPTQPIVNCSDVRISPTLVRIECSAAGVVVLNTTVRLPQVTLPPVEIEVPGPTIRVPGPTVRVPGPTQTATVYVPDGAQTVNVPGPTVTRTAQPTSGPTVSTTETVTVSPSGQEPSDDDTLPVRDPVVTIPDIDTVPEAIGLGLLATLGLMALILLAMWAGYIMGFKDKERKDDDFFQALLDSVRAGKHR